MLHLNPVTSQKSLMSVQKHTEHTLPTLKTKIISNNFISNKLQKNITPSQENYDKTR